MPSESQRPQILLTNDDGIRSPGLWAAADALSELGFVTVVAPREQASGSGRSMPPSSDGQIHEQRMEVGGQSWTVYSVGGTPAQTVQHAILEIMPGMPDLMVAGINYGENVTTSITISGTVGAAMEAASFGIPALAASLETDREHHLSYSETVDFSTAAHFTQLLAAALLETDLPADVDLLKVDVPSDATEATEWRMTRLERTRYYLPRGPERDQLDEPGTVDYDVVEDAKDLTPGSDAYALRVEGQVAVTPLSLDMTARVDLEDLGRTFRALGSPG